MQRNAAAWPPGRLAQERHAGSRRSVQVARAQTQNRAQDRARPQQLRNRGRRGRHTLNRRHRRSHREQHHHPTPRVPRKSSVPLPYHPATFAQLHTHAHNEAFISAAAKVEAGGLSGAPLKAASLTAVRTLRARLPSYIPLIGCGGIASGADALEFARAGASFVQVYTSFGYDGAGAPRRIKDELAAQLKAEGTTWSAVVQKAVDGLSLKEEQGGSGVGLLIRQAEELKGLLDSLGEKMAREEVESSVDLSAAVSTPSANP